MHKVTSKRQITLPQTVCKAMSLGIGDYVEVFERDGVAHIVKINSESLAGKFQHLLNNKTFPSSEELQNSLKNRAAKRFNHHDSD